MKIEWHFPIQDLFAYQGVYQRHLLRHRENKEIDDNELTPILAESVRRAEEINKQDHTPVQVLEEDGDDNDDEAAVEEAEEPEEQLEETEELQELEEELNPDEDDDENGDLVAEEENKIALKLQNKTNRVKIEHFILVT